MDITETALLEIWEIFTDYLAPAKKNEAAVRFLRALVDNGVELDDLESLRDEDEHIDYAFDELSSRLEDSYDEESDYEE